MELSEITGWFQETVVWDILLFTFFFKYNWQLTGNLQTQQLIHNPFMSSLLSITTIGYHQDNHEG